MRVWSIFEFQAMDFRVAAFDERFANRGGRTRRPWLRIRRLRGRLRWKDRGREAAAGGVRAALLALSSASLYFTVVLRDLKIVLRFDDFHLQAAVVDLAENLAGLHRAAFVLR